MNINNWESCKKQQKKNSAHFIYLLDDDNVLPPANRCIADRGFEYRYIASFKPTYERAIISDNSIQPY